MTGSAWTELQAVLKRLSKRQGQTYHDRVASWTRELKRILPDEALLYLAQCAEQRRHPEGPRVREIVARFTQPDTPRPAA